MPEIIKFPKNFLFGSATSAYQIEGGNIYSDWEDYYPAGNACDHYNRFKEDIDWISKLNQNAYRFSIEWSRIEKQEGKFDEKEIKHYREVLLYLKEKNIHTMLTLFHFSLPKWFAKKGGFTKKRNIAYFRRYANEIFNNYHDLVDFWIVENEPQVWAAQSYFRGVWPPKKKSIFLYLKVIRNLVNTHKIVYRDFHKKDKNVLVGIAKNNQFFEPARKDSILDKLVVRLTSWWQNKYFLNKISKSIDFIGLNYYFHKKIEFPFRLQDPKGKLSDTGWEIYPEGIYYILYSLKKYKKPIFVTENGVADSKDYLRKDFIKDHLYWIWKAIKDGVDVRGYFYWSLIDNFEWEKGTGPRFGLLKVDYNTMERVPRKSAYYYSDISKEKALKIKP